MRNQEGRKKREKRAEQSRAEQRRREKREEKEEPCSKEEGIFSAKMASHSLPSFSPPQLWHSKVVGGLVT